MSITWLFCKGCFSIQVGPRIFVVLSNLKTLVVDKTLLARKVRLLRYNDLIWKHQRIHEVERELISIIILKGWNSSSLPTAFLMRC